MVTLFFEPVRLSMNNEQRSKNRGIVRKSSTSEESTHMTCNNIEKNAQTINYLRYWHFLNIL